MSESPLSQGRELKYRGSVIALARNLVAPLAGARIEIFSCRYMYTSSRVAPLAGARIEMSQEKDVSYLPASPLSQGRELK